MGLLRVSYLASYLAFLLAVGVLLLATIVIEDDGGNQQPQQPQPAARVDTDSGGTELTSQPDLPLGEAGDGSSSNSNAVWVSACSDEAVAKRLYLLVACMLAVVQVSPLVAMAREDGGTR